MTTLLHYRAISEQSRTGRRRRYWIGFAAFIILLHVALLFIGIPRMGRWTGIAYNQAKLADGYDLLAENLAAGRGYRFYPDTAATTMREPGYPLILAGLELAFGPGLVPVQLLNALFVFATAFVILIFALKYVWKPGSGMLPVVAGPTLFLVHPGVLIAESRGGVEITFGFLVVAFLYLLLKAIESRRWTGYVLCGFVLGITVLIRSVPILFLAFLLPFLFVFHTRQTSRLAILRNISLMGLTMTAVLTPWIIRNYLLLGSFVPTASVFGVSAQAGQYINEHLFEGRPFWLLDREAARQRDLVAIELGYPFKDGREGYYQTFYRSQDEVLFSKYLTAQVIAEYKRHPVQFLQTLAHNIVGFWVTGKTWNATLANTVVQIPYLVLAIAGCRAGFRRNRVLIALFLTFIGYVIAVHAPVLAQARYSIPLLPLLCVLSTFVFVPGRRDAVFPRNN